MYSHFDNLLYFIIYQEIWYSDISGFWMSGFWTFTVKLVKPKLDILFNSSLEWNYFVDILDFVIPQRVLL